jgi:hypothetical protein
MAGALLTNVDDVFLWRGGMMKRRVATDAWCRRCLVLVRVRSKL